MSYVQTHFWPGGTEDEYRTTLAVVHPSGLPDGQLYHAAGAAEGGVLILVVWESKEHADRFISERLMPSLPIEGGLVGPPEERAGEVFNLETV
ncbi:MAG: hypothetical protein ACRDQH_05180 [Pseudonocardiaceae bacterium]